MEDQKQTPQGEVKEQSQEQKTQTEPKKEVKEQNPQLEKVKELLTDKVKELPIEYTPQEKANIQSQRRVNERVENCSKELKILLAKYNVVIKVDMNSPLNNPRITLVTKL